MIPPLFTTTRLFFRSWFKEIYLYPSPVQVQVNDKEKHEQDAIWQVNLAKENKDTLTTISLTKT
jgi:hypothetical protein